MANREIKTTLVLDGEAKFKQSLQSVDREMRTLSSELGEVTSAYGKNETSMSKCKAIGENLAKQIDQQKVKLNALEGAVSDSKIAYDKAVKAYDEAAEAFGENSTQAQLAAKAVDKAEKSLDGYKTQCNNAQKKLNDLNAAQKKNDETAKKLSISFEDVAKKAKEVGEACAKAAAKAAELGGKVVTGALNTGTKALEGYATAAVAAGTALFKLSADSALAADDINTLATQTGLSTEAIQKFQYASKLIDVDVDTLTGSMAKLVKNMNTATKGTGDAYDAFQALGISIKDDVTGELRNNQDVFNDAITALGSIENETQRDAYAMSMFGKSAQDLNPLILGGADALKTLGNSADEAGLILSQDALDHLNEFNDSIDIMKANTSAAGKVISTAVSDDFKQITDTIGAAVPDIAKQFAALFSSENTAEAQAAFTDSINKLSNDVGEKVNEKLPVFLDAFNTVILAVAKQIPSGMTALLPPMLDGLLGLVNGIIDAIPELLPVITDGGIELFSGLLDGINNAIDMLMPMIPDLIDSIAGAVVNGVPKIIDGGFDLLIGLANGIDKAMPKVIEKIGELIPDIAETITKSLPQLVKASTNVITGLIKALSKELPKITKEIAKLIPMIINTLIDAIPDLLDASIDFLSAVVDALPIVITELVRALPKLIDKIVNTVVDAAPELLDAAVKLFAGLAQAAGTAVEELVKSLPELVGSIAGGLASCAQQITAGAFTLFNGITTEGDKSLDVIKKNTDAIVPFTEAMKNASPETEAYTGILDKYGNSLDNIDTKISTVEQAITDTLANAMSEQQTLRDNDILNLKQYVKKLQELETQKLALYSSQAAANLEAIKLDAADGLTSSEAASAMGNAKTYQDQANSAAEQARNTALTNAKNMWTAGAYISKYDYEDDIAEINAAYNAAIAQNQSLYSSAVNEVTKATSSWLATDELQAFADIGKANESTRRNSDDTGKNIWNALADWSGSYDGWYNAINDKMATLNTNAANSYVTMAAEAATNGEKMSASMKTNIDNILSAFENLPPECEDAGKNALLGIVKGLDEYNSQLSDASGMSAQEIVNALKTTLDIHSPSKVTEEIGEYTIKGLIDGMNSKLNELLSAADFLASSLTNELNSKIAAAINTAQMQMVAAAQSVSAISSASSGLAGTASTTTTRNTKSTSLTINNNSPKAMTQYEQMQQARKAAQLISVWG